MLVLYTYVLVVSYVPAFDALFLEEVVMKRRYDNWKDSIMNCLSDSIDIYHFLFIIILIVNWY